MHYNVRLVRAEDVDNGLLETLANLRDLDLRPLEAKRLVEEIGISPFCRLYVATTDNTVVGAATLLVEQKLIRSGGKVGHIEDVATRAGYERLGIGSTIIRRLVADAREAGCYKVILDCNRDNVPFYSKLGFYEHEIEMRLDLL